MIVFVTSGHSWPTRGSFDTAASQSGITRSRYETLGEQLATNIPHSLRGKVLQPTPDVRAIAAIAELALEIGLLAGNYPVADDEDEGYQRHQQPEAVKDNGQADKPQ